MNEPKASTELADGPSYYANGIRVRTTPWDLTLHFTLETPLGASGEAFSRAHQCNVSLSIPIAKILTRLLHEQVAAYEQGIGGEVPVPKPRAPDGAQ